MRRLATLALATSLLAAGCTGKASHETKPEAPAEPAAKAKAAPAKAPAPATKPAAPAKTKVAAPEAAAAGGNAPAKPAPAAEGKPPPKPWPKGQPKIDAPVKDFTLKDPAGRAHSLYGAMGKHGVVVVFVSTRCPYATAYDGLLRKLARRYEKRGIRFLAVDANPDETPQAVAAWHRQAHLPFPVLLDAQGRVAKALGARATPDTYLIGADHLLRYHGGIGNAIMPTTDPRRVNATDLEAALKSHLAGRRPLNPIVHSFGCPLHR